MMEGFIEEVCGDCPTFGHLVAIRWPSKADEDGEVLAVEPLPATGAAAVELVKKWGG